MHLEAAARFGLNDYDRIMTELSMGEALSAAILFPERKKQLVRYVDQKVPGAEKLVKRFKRVLRKIYENSNWSQYSLVGFTVNFQQLFTSLLLAKWLRHDFPEIFTVLGGVITSGDIGKSIIKHFPQIDWCISGEGEITLIEILKHLETGKEGFEHKVSGLMYRNEGGIVVNPTKQLKLHGLPDPDYEHYFELKKTDPVLRNLEIPTYTPVEVSRGCPYKCAFCCDHQCFKGYRKRPADDAAASIKRLCNKYQTTSIFLLAQTVTPELCEELFPILATHNSDYKIFCEMRADLTKEHMKLMKAAGVIRVQVGIEALHTPLLKKMHKGTRLIDNLKIMKYCEEIGIETAWYFLTNFPTETQRYLEHNASNIDYAATYFPAIKFAEFMLFEKSAVYRYPRKYGIHSINEAARFGKYLPLDIAPDIKLWYKDFKFKRKPHNYKKLKNRYEKWKKEYEDSQKSGRPLLCYYDSGHFLQVEDFREDSNSIALEGWARELYLFCDSIRSWDDIKNRFSDVSEMELKRTLNKLFKLKVMFKEGNDWLSLAIHASPENRRHMPFL